MRRAIALTLFLGVAACHTPDAVAPPRAPFLPPVTRTQASLAAPLHFGSPWPAELAQVTTFSAEECLAVRARFILLHEKPVVGTAAPLDHRTSVIIGPGTGKTRLAPVLAAGALYLDADAVARAPLRTGQLIGDVATALADDVTVRLACFTERPEPAPVVSGLPSPVVEETFALRMRRRSIGRTRAGASRYVLDAAVELAASAAPPPPEPLVPLDRTERGVSASDVHALHEGALAKQRETAELVALRPEPIEGRDRFAILVPSPFEGAPGWVMAVIELRPAPLSGEPGAALHERNVAVLRAQVAGERVHFARRPAPDTLPGIEQSPVDRPRPDVAAIRSELRTWPRRGLVRLGEAVSAPLAVDAALGADDSTLSAVAREVERGWDRRLARESLAAGLGGLPGAALVALRTPGWELDLAVLTALLRAENRKAARSILERRFGAAFEADVSATGGAHLPRAKRLSSSEALERIVLERNLLSLEDTRPGVRVVAARWLARLRPGLLGYDAFAPFEERRVAVDRLWQALVPEETP